MYTYSGEQITWDSGVFTVDDIGWQLASVNRWGGATHEPFSVAQHSLAMYDLLNYETAYWRLAALFHDAHEVITGDGCPPFKTDDHRDMQRALDERIFRDTLGLEIDWEDPKWNAIKTFDEMLAAAEANMICHPKVSYYFPLPAWKYFKANSNWRGKSREEVAQAFVRAAHEMLAEIG